MPRDIEFAEKPAHFISDDVLRECAELFSNHYGVWGANPYNLKPGNRVKMSSGAMRKQLVTDEECSVILARSSEGMLVGHAFVKAFYYPPGKGTNHYSPTNAAASFIHQSVSY